MEKIGFKRQDSIFFTNKFMNRANIKKEIKARESLNFETQFLDSHELLNVSSAILTENASGIVNPYLLTQNIFQYLSNFDNVKIYENTEIVDIKCGYQKVECITNNDFKITVDTTIFTTGFETLKYVRTPIIDVNKSFTIVTNKLKELEKKDTNFTAKDNIEPYHYIRFSNDNRIILSGENVKFTEKLNDEKALAGIAKDRYKKLYNVLKRYIYPIDNMKVEYSYNSTFVNTKDTLPIIDEIPNMPNCFCNLAFGKNGILYSVIGANILKNAIKGFYTKDVNMFKLVR